MSAVLNDQNKVHVVNNLVPKVDYLVPTKPIKEFVEFGTNSVKDDLTASPNYIFQVNDLKTMILHETVLMGKKFPIPKLNCSAQIKCDVRYDLFRLSIRFLDPKKNGQLIDRLKIIKMFIVIQKQNTTLSSNEELVHQFPFQSQLVYGTFAPISTLSYDQNLKSAYNKLNDSVTLHLHVQVVTEDLFLDDGIWLWKVDVSRGQLRSPLAANKVEELGLSPFFHVHPNELRVQIRLFVPNGDNCLVESRVVNESGWSGHYDINLYVIHPTDPTRPRLTSSFDFRTWEPIILSEPKYSDVLVFARKRELEEYVSEGKLLVKVEIKRPIV